MIITYVILYIIQLSFSGCLSPSKKSFTIDYEHDQFLKDGKPFRYISGSIHYFRVPAQYWQDRLYKIKKAGMNAIQTYVAWNMHEPFKGDYRFSGDNNITAFIELAQKNDLLVVLRPGPYICAEWEYGGFPYWIMKEVTSSQLRTSSEVYLDIVDKWMSVFLSKMKPLLYSNGGPIISVQVEDGYGGYGNDHVYMKKLEDMFRKYLGDDVILFTTDGAGDWYLQRGAIPSLYTTIDFGAGGDPKKTFQIQRKYQPHGPLVNSEYYTGWLDHWGSRHSRTSGKRVAKSLGDMLAINASVNMYMFEGGTNFGFMNGANYGKSLQPQPTSYDYDAPLSEAGDPTAKYFLIQNVISKYSSIPPGPAPVPTQKASYGKIQGWKMISLYKLINYIKPFESVKPLSFEDIDLPYGYVLYRVSIPPIFFSRARKEKAVLSISKLHDRATVMVDGKLQGVIYSYNSTIKISSGSVLDILVENQGRVNYGGQMRDTAKGILSTVLLNGQVVNNWKMFPINESILLHSARSAFNEHASNTVMSRDTVTAPALTYFAFPAFSQCDTYLKLDYWTKGIALLNGFNLGRYWTPAGPQRTLYVPRYQLKRNNTLIVFETDRIPTGSSAFVEFVDKPIWSN